MAQNERFAALQRERMTAFVSSLGVPDSRYVVLICPDTNNFRSDTTYHICLGCMICVMLVYNDYAIIPS